MRTLLAIMATLALAGCNHVSEDSTATADQVQKNSSQVASNVGNGAVALATQIRDNINVTSEHLHAWLIEPPPGKGTPQAIPPSYCYFVLQDILCYRQPMPGGEHRLVGYQGTDAAPPSATAMQSLGVTKAEPKPFASATNRVANAQPVFVKPPPEIKDVKPSSDSMSTSTSTDATHEQLPDPALAPQL